MDKYWVWFSRINKIEIRDKQKLLKKFKTPENIFKSDKKSVCKILNNEQTEILFSKYYKQNIEKYIEYMENNEIKLITMYDKNYPAKLQNIYDPPVALYVKGNIKILNDKSIAIIGSRACSDYGSKIAKQFAYNLSRKNINIISGLAKGIDTYAHRGAIEAKGKTIAVFGNGLDIAYPHENSSLIKAILENEGLIISEYIVGTKPEKMFFPARNRIISALSNGVLVVEASHKSGTSITVDFALEQGKNIYAIPRKNRWY